MCFPTSWWVAVAGCPWVKLVTKRVLHQKPPALVSSRKPRTAVVCTETNLSSNTHNNWLSSSKFEKVCLRSAFRQVSIFHANKRQMWSSVSNQRNSKEDLIATCYMLHVTLWPISPNRVLSLPGSSINHSPADQEALIILHGLEVVKGSLTGL